MAVQFQNNLPRIIPRVPKELAKLVRKTAFGIEAKAKALAPVDTGLLRNSIQTDVERPLKATIGTNVEYAPHQEFGTRHQKGKPFLTPAADEQRTEFEREVKRFERSLK